MAISRRAVRHRRRLIHCTETSPIDPVGALTRLQRPGILATMPVLTSVFMIRGESLPAFVSWVASTAAFITWCAVRLGKAGTWEERRSSQPEV